MLLGCSHNSSNSSQYQSGELYYLNVNHFSKAPSCTSRVSILLLVESMDGTSRADLNGGMDT
jgi:hypothetical protein